MPPSGTHQRPDENRCQSATTFSGHVCLHTLLNKRSFRKPCSPALAGTLPRPFRQSGKENGCPLSMRRIYFVADPQSFLTTQHNEPTTIRHMEDGSGTVV
jgi:hypothetical protein